MWTSLNKHSCSLNLKLKFNSFLWPDVFSVNSLTAAAEMTGLWTCLPYLKSAALWNTKLMHLIKVVLLPSKSGWLLNRQSFCHIAYFQVFKASGNAVYKDPAKEETKTTTALKYRQRMYVSDSEEHSIRQKNAEILTLRMWTGTKNLNRTASAVSVRQPRHYVNNKVKQK